MQVIEYELKNKNDLIISEIETTGLIGIIDNNLMTLVK